ncbi:hypothetical protein WQ56_01875 [Luteimonas sp. FCS-9]|nr:hypothetical protein WQ56_01875 [Luteimonas sp. FCS-9]
MHYAHQHQVPLDLTSSSTITAIPVILTLILILVFALVILLLMPAWFLLIRGGTGSASLANEIGAAGARRRSIVWHWSLSIIAPTMALLLATIPDTNPSSTNLLTLVAAILALTTLIFVRSTGRHAREIPFDLWLNAAFASLAQLFALITVILACLRFAERQDSVPLAVALIVATTATLGVVQIGAAMIARRIGSHSRPLTVIGQYVAVGLTLLVLIPSASATLVGAVLRAPLTGGAACAEVTWAPGRAPPDLGTRLFVVAPAGDILLVRKPGEPRPTYFVPRANIASLYGIGCHD